LKLLLNLQGFENLGGFWVCCGVYFKPPRCCETLEVFGFAAVFILTLQGVVKPWRFFFGFAVLFILTLQGVVKPWRFLGLLCCLF